MDIFGLYKSKAKNPVCKKIADSFAGKLLIHTIRFKDTCNNVSFFTNVNFDDDVEDFIEAVAEDKTDNQNYSQLVEYFNDTFCPGTPVIESDVKELIKKLKLNPNITYIDPNDDSFASKARETVL